MATVFLFHCARFFDTEGWHVKSARRSPTLDIVIIFTVQWMMPLFFILSGIAAYHSLSRRHWPQYLASRFKRLVVPLVFGIFVIIAPWQVYLERVSHGQYSGSFRRWFPHYFDGWYGLGGNFAWMGVHLWYLEILFVFSVLALPLFLYLRSSSGVRRVETLSRFLSRPGFLFLLAIPIAITAFIGMTPPVDRTILGNESFGGWGLLPYLVLLILGYLLAANEELARTMERSRIAGLVTGIFAFIVGYVIYRATEQWPWLPRNFVLCVLRGVLCWSWLIAICGFASRHLRFRNDFLKYANEAVLPFYILHQTIILTVGYYVIRLNAALWLEYLIITIISFAAIMAVYEFLIKRLNLLRVLFGMKVRRRVQLAPAAHPLGFR